MELLKYTGSRPEEPRDTPDREEIEQLARQGLIQELVSRILKWKGEANLEYFETQWDLRPDQVRDAARSLADVEIEQVNQI